MAKINGKMRLTIGIVSLVVIGAGLVANYTLHGADIKVNTDKVTELKKDGCKPAAKATQDIAVIKYQLNDIETRQGEMRKENRASFKEVLEEIRKK